MWKKNNNNKVARTPASQLEGEKSIFKLRRIKRVLRVGKPFTLGDTPRRRVLLKLPMSVDIKKIMNVTFTEKLESFSFDFHYIIIISNCSCCNMIIIVVLDEFE